MVGVVTYFETKRSGGNDEQGVEFTERVSKVSGD